MAVVRTGRVGLYVHVPFCAAHCPYCDFAVTVTRRIPHEEYLAAVLTELESRRGALVGRTLRTIYFGGGTPGLWSADAIAAVIERAVPLAENASIDEITVELNPGFIERAWLERVAAAGVNRISLGAQSLDRDTLTALGRTHTPEDVRRAIEDAVSVGIGDVSVDLIYGAPNATPATVAEDVRAFAALAHVDHVSAYELTWEPGTAFARRRRQGLLTAPDEDALVRMASVVDGGLGAAGFERYEVSNWARPGHEARHNSAYWAGHEYVGVGVGAHSMEIDDAGQVVRRENPRGLRHYLGDPRSAAETEIVDAETHLAECVMVAVRTRAGIDPDALRARFGAVSSRLDPLIARWIAEGWLSARSGRFVPTEAGFRFADSMALDALSAFGGAPR